MLFHSAILTGVIACALIPLALRRRESLGRAVGGALLLFALLWFVSYAFPLLVRWFRRPATDSEGTALSAMVICLGLAYLPAALAGWLLVNGPRYGLADPRSGIRLQRLVGLTVALFLMAGATLSILIHLLTSAVAALNDAGAAVYSVLISVYCLVIGLTLMALVAGLLGHARVWKPCGYLVIGLACVLAVRQVLPYLPALRSDTPASGEPVRVWLLGLRVTNVAALHLTLAFALFAAGRLMPRGGSSTDGDAPAGLVSSNPPSSESN